MGLLNCEGLKVSLIPDVEKGEVLIDSRGKGSLQNAKYVRRSERVSRK